MQEAWRGVAQAALDDLLALDPVEATALGEHAHDDRLPDLSEAALAERRRILHGHLGLLDGVDDVNLDVAEQVDLEILRAQLAKRLFALDELREHTWNPLVANPGSALYLLLARDFAPLPERLTSLAGRLAAVPEALATARASLTTMPAVHVETAIAQFEGTVHLLATEVERALEAEPALRSQVEPARAAAAEALTEHVAWLHAALPDAHGDPRLGEQRYAAKLWHTLDDESTPEAVLIRAESDLMRIEEELAALAGGPTKVRAAARPARRRGPRSTTLRRCRCAARPGRGHRASSAPSSWSSVPRRRRPDHRDAGDPPGRRRRVLRLARAAGVLRTADILRGRADPGGLAGRAGALVLPGVQRPPAAEPDGARGDAGARAAAGARATLPGVDAGAVGVRQWCVRGGLGCVRRGADGPGRVRGTALRAQQLKMQLRTAINAILDVRVHTRAMTEAEAMTLMTVRGHQEEGEAAGKWRRVLLTSTQLPTYHVGYAAVSRPGRRPGRRPAGPEHPGAARHDAGARLPAAAPPSNPAEWASESGCPISGERAARPCGLCRQVHGPCDGGCRPLRGRSYRSC